MNELPLFLLASLGAYLLGCLPAGYLISKYLLGFDITQKGSGNIGMTNVIRSGGLKAGIATLLLDFGKGALAVFLFRSLFPEAPEEQALAIGLCSVLGHTKNIFLKFKGGKGIATHLGIWSAFSPVLFLTMAGTWLAVFSVSRISSLSALTMLFALAISAYFIFQASFVFWLTLAEVTYLFILHKDNIRRILKGEEKKLTSKSTQ